MVHIYQDKDQPKNHLIQISAESEPLSEMQPSKKHLPGLIGLGELFTIDTMPADKLDIVHVPSYKRAIKDALTPLQQQKKDAATNVCTRPARFNSECFNCGAKSHSLRECRKPRNNQRINRAKKAMTSKQERYHVDIEQRYAHLRPGCISGALKNALGLRGGQLPFFFYRMRKLGYPHGWLEDAKVAQSGIAIFNSSDKKVERCNIDDSNDIDHKYDVSKIIDFPGFNSDPGSNFFDDYKHHNVPPFGELPLKGEFIQSLGDNVVKSYMRKKFAYLPDGAGILNTIMIDRPANHEPADMVLEERNNEEDGDIQFERLTSLSIPRCNSINLNNINNTMPLSQATESQQSRKSEKFAVNEGSRSPSLAILEAQQAQLLQELQSNYGAATNDATLLNMTDNVFNDTDSTPLTPVVLPGFGLAKDSRSGRLSDIIKTTHIGTPVMYFSLYEELPGGDKFKVGVSDVINFENLPDSTGKYDQMKLLIEKVRNTRRRLNEEYEADDDPTSLDRNATA